MRNLTKTIAAVSLLMPVSAYPLGIGDIKLHSALNQKLDAEIALLVSAGEDVSDITVRLASPDKFDDAGVPWSYFLSNIKFKAITQADGSTVVKLSSQEVLREPFLDFLLEVTWANGSLFREFTVLVDPPVTYKKPTLPVMDKPRQVASYTTNKPVNIERRVVKTVTGQYGPTGRMDSMWKIAEKTNVYDDVSIEQMMMSIYEANPKAFYKKNVNALMAGQTLKIPEKNVILKLSKKQALAAFKQQDNVWRGRVTQKTEPLGRDDSQLASQLELEAPLVDVIGESVDVITGDKAAKHIVDSEISDSIIARSDEGLALQARMDRLEQQLVMMQKILILKDEQIATLQNKKTAEIAEPTVKQQQAVEPGKVKIKKLAEVIADKKAAEEAEKIEKQKEVAAIEETKPAAAKIKPIVKSKPKIKLKPAPIVEEQTDYLSLAIGGGSVIIFSLLGLIWWRRRQAEDNISDESMFATASEINLPNAADDELSIPIAEDSSLYDVGTVGESSFLSEFTPSDFDAFDTDESEVDPISEADVYLAYGRYQQAEDLMVQAIKDFPERDECKLKLLEIFYTHENNSSFEAYAKELVAEGKPENTEFWAKVVEMGSELDPESTLYIDHASFESVDLEQEKQKDDSTAAEESSQTTVNESLSDLDEDKTEVDFDLSIFDDAATPAEENKAEVVTPAEVEENNSDENLLDFDLSIFDIDSDDKTAEVKQTENVETVEFDLDSIASDDFEQEETKLEEVKDTADIESFDFDFDLGSVTENNAEPEAITLDEGLESEIDLESFDFSSNVEEEVKEKTSLDSKVDGVDEATVDDFDFDFDEPTLPVTTAPVTELDASVSDLTDMDELETKLDLAKAYIDMGDTEAAKDIAEEVLEKGTAEQKTAAQEVLDQLK